jgi:hypothetical protein
MAATAILEHSSSSSQHNRVPAKATADEFGRAFMKALFEEEEQSGAPADASNGSK